MEMKGSQVPQEQYKTLIRSHNPKVVGSNPAPATIRRGLETLVSGPF